MCNSKKSAGIIYTVKNKVTGKFYVGATSDSVEMRRKDHEQKATNNSGYYFQQAISTYGVDAFEWKEIDSAKSINELARKEKDYVIKYNSKEEGYNSDRGGGMKKTVYKYSVERGRLLDSYDCLESAANAVNATKKQISRACLSVNKVFGDYIWSYELIEPFSLDLDKRFKEVLQLDFENNLIDVFCSVSVASKVTGFNRSSIAKVCRGERNQAGGYRWIYNQ